MSRRRKQAQPPRPAPAQVLPAAAPPPPGARGRWILLAALVIGVAVASVAGVRAWSWHRLLGRVRSSIPAMPALAGAPKELVDLLAAAQTRARSSDRMLEGVAELGRLYQANSYSAQAEVCWRLLIEAQPDEARWCYYLAHLRREAGDQAGMLALLERTIHLAPGYAPAWLQLADFEFKTGRMDDAERNYGRRLALLPGDRYARLGLARIAMQRGQQAEARKMIEQLVKDAPDFPTAHNIYAEMLAADGDTEKATRERWLGRETGRFREAEDPWIDELNDGCYDFDRLCVLGAIESQGRRYDRARAFFERAIQVRPGEPAGYELLESLQIQLNQPEKARATIEEAIRRLRPAKPTVSLYIDLAHTYRMLKQPAEAVRITREGIAALGEGFELDDALGVALGDLGRKEEAVDALQRALARNPDDTVVNYNLAVGLLAAGRLDEAMVALHHSLALRPTFPASLVLLGQIEMDSGRWQSALQYVQPLFDSHPEMAPARQLMAFWHLLAGMDAEKKKDLAAAEKHYREGVSIDPHAPELHARLGTLCLILGRFADAVPPLEAYHKIQPENPQADLFLGQAYAGTGRREDARRILTEGAALADKAGNATTARHCREILQQL